MFILYFLYLQIKFQENHISITVFKQMLRFQFFCDLKLCIKNKFIDQI